jgi:hypothetical protein
MNANYCNAARSAQHEKNQINVGGALEEEMTAQ